MRVALLVVAAAVAAALGVGVARGERLPKRFGSGCSGVTVASVPAELCSSAAARASGEAVVVLHGCGGFGALDYQLASELPAAGIATIYPAFFVASGTPPGGKGFCDARRADFPNAFEEWRQVVLAAARRLHRVAGVRRVGVVGWSLGGGLAVAVAEDPTRPFRALACFSCGAFGPVRDAAGGLPPTLVLSGGTTDAIPLSASLELVDAAHARGVHAELFVWPHGTHQWYGAQGKAGKRRAIAFLHRYLKS